VNHHRSARTRILVRALPAVDVTAGDGPLGVHMAPSGAPYLLFVTLPACLVMTTLTAWAGPRSESLMQKPLLDAKAAQT